ncbi:hypothetical protein EZS27_023933 [termite gut metagenome]|uniref:Uncharacterized protein n=1 Tax=termite gut metagenome TaxID=433724 RepID=A0A5J4R0H9_9ZZZZ
MFHIIQQTLLIPFDGEKIMTSLINYLLCYSGLGSNGVYGNYRIN